jgi:nickel-dependent lactate racemase
VKKVVLSYGEHGLGVEVPDNAVIVESMPRKGLRNERDAVTNALRNPDVGPPLAELVQPGAQVVVVLPDITRPMPNRTVLPPLLDELERLGVSADRIELLVATGTHRPASESELEELVGSEILRRYYVRNHRAGDGRHILVGTVAGVPVLLDRAYVEADVRIVTGFVEPHFFAGFSGGWKAVCPGLADMETILEAHSPVRIADSRATWTNFEGNPVHEFIASAARLAPPTFAIDVAITDERRLVRVFAGRLPDSHRLACEFVRSTVSQEVSGRFDIVLTTNGGYPLDRNLYQTVKGIAAAERVALEGGVILVAAECRDGIPSEGAFGTLLQLPLNDLEDAGAPSTLDRWQAQVLARIAHRFRVCVFSDGLSDEDIAGAHLQPIHDIRSALDDELRRRPHARLCVLPFGPLTVATPSSV